MIHAQGEYVVVEFIPQEEAKTASGIIIGKDDRKRDGDIVFLATGRLVSAGKEVTLQAGIGDIVLYTPIDANTYLDTESTGKETRYDVLNYKHVKAKV